MDYLPKGKEVAETLQSYNNQPEEKWTVVKNDKNYIIRCQPSEEFSGKLYKGEAVYNCSPETVFNYVDPLPDKPRATWDKNMKKIEVLKWLDKDLGDGKTLRINRACTDSALLGIVSPRDFIDLIYTNTTDEYISTNAISIEYDDCPPTKDHVRGWNWPCGMICYRDKEDPNKCKLISLIQPDIKGILPQGATDRAVPGSMTEFFTVLRETLKKDGHISS